jgi:hypothetical protein
VPADTGASSSSSILEVDTSAQFIKTDESIQPQLPEVQWVLVTFSLPEFNLKKKYVLLKNFMQMTILSPQAHMI